TSLLQMAETLHASDFTSGSPAALFIWWSTNLLKTQGLSARSSMAIFRKVPAIATPTVPMISDGFPTDDEGFPKPANPDLANALRAIEKAVTVLSMLALRMARDGL